MAKPIKVKINVLRLLKQHFFKGDKGTYCTLVLWPKKEGKDQFGNTHSVKQEISREARDAGEQEPFVGDATFPDEERGGQASARPAAAKTPPPADDWEDPDALPF